MRDEIDEYIAQDVIVWDITVPLEEVESTMAYLDSRGFPEHWTKKYTSMPLRQIPKGHVVIEVDLLPF